MNYITNASGEVQVQDEKGETKFLPKHLAENRFLMQGQGLIISEGVKKFEPEPAKEKAEEKKEEKENKAETKSKTK